jgi:hypothetical protein
MLDNFVQAYKTPAPHFQISNLKSQMSLFTAMGDFARKTRTVRMAAPEDVLHEERVWSAEDQMKPFAERGEPRVKLHIRPGAPTMDFRIRPLSMAERECAEKITDAAIPPQTYVEEQPVRPGDIPKKIPTGYDYEAPEYLAALRPLQDEQAAYVVLKGVVDLEQDTPGATDPEKVRAITTTMPSRIVRFLASEIWAMTYAQGSPADFFMNEGSSSSPSSAPSPSKSPRGPKRKS